MIYFVFVFVVDFDWIVGSLLFMKMEVLGDIEFVISFKFEDGGDEGEEIIEFFSYDCLKVLFMDFDLKINVKRKEVCVILKFIV